MRTRPLITSIATIVVWLAGSAQAETIAGWDFSQYIGDGRMITSGALIPSNTLGANYSSRAAAPGAGPPAAVFGTAYFDGSFGSTSVDPTSANPALVPSAALTGGSLASNRSAPEAPGYVPFDARTALQSAGQPFFSLIGVTAPQSALAVFSADLGVAPPPSNHWELSLGGRTFSGSSAVDVEFSTDGISYSPMTTFNLTTTDTRFSAPLTAAVTDTAFVRVSLDPSVGQPIIDNVAIVLLPEPSSTIQAATGLLFLGSCHIVGRRRRS